MPSKNDVLQYIETIENSDELSELISLLENRITELKKTELVAFAQQAQGLADKLGIPKDELFSAVNSLKTTKARSSLGKNIEPKYQNPNNLDEKWTGRGKIPNWLTEWLEKNPTKTKEDLLIKK